MIQNEKQMLLCRQCSNCTINLEDGLVCSFTKKKADFEETCSGFQKKAKRK